MSYQGERNKVVVTVDETESDLSYVRKEFTKAFNHANDISIDVTFHKYDPDRDDYVDLSNDCILEAKEKLKVVITPRIVTPCSILNDSVSLSALAAILKLAQLCNTHVCDDVKCAF